ncbi:hypothetical protein [Agarilytica rhodophyticola]|uniref:hypothetical protein n=1 Tax=Agarilytica rhodophyticola TaxID=1737490 RepID=UPI000B348730|nr:hypothetical protein [Agarilytica rhodophyticola]
MTVHIEEMTTEIAAIEGDLPLSSQQMDKLVALVLQRIDEQQRDDQAHNESATIRSEATPSLQAGWS